MDVPDDGVSNDHSVTFRLAESNKAVAGGDFENRWRRRGEVIVRGLDRFFRCCTQGPWFPSARVKDIWVLAACCILTPDLWASARDVSSVAFHFISWVCFPSSSWICLSMASISSCTECSSNVSSPALKCRHKSAIKASTSETMVNVCK